MALQRVQDLVDVKHTRLRVFGEDGWPVALRRARRRVAVQDSVNVLSGVEQLGV